MKSVCKWAGAVILCMLVFSLPATAKGEFTKTIKKEFDTARDGTTSISNKFGKVDIKTWDKNRVKVDVRIIVKAGSESAAQKVFDRINIAFMNTGGNYVKAETNIESDKKEWWDWSPTKSDFSIVYEVFMPPTNKLELYTKYCDVYVAALSGEAIINVNYGNFKMEGVTDKATIALAYGNGSVARAQNVNVDIKHSNIRFEEARDVDITSKYANVSFEKAGEVRSTSRYDTYRLGDIQDFRNTGKYDNIEIQEAKNVLISSQYTNVKLAKINRSVDLNLEYGGAVIGQLSKGFSDANLLGKYSDFKVSLEPGVVYQLDAAANSAGITYPSDLTVTYEREKSTSHEVKGHVGSQNTPSVIKARLSYGGLRVKQE